MGFAQKVVKFIEQEAKIISSAGISSNKLLAKVACKYNKPNGITALTRQGFNRICSDIDFRDLTGLGGDLGEKVENLFGQLYLNQLRNMLNFTWNLNCLANWVGYEDTEYVREIANGICYQEVEDKLMFDGLNCGRGYLKIETKGDFRSELNYLAQNLKDRLNLEVKYNKRFAKNVLVQYTRRTLGGIYTESFNVEFNPVTDFGFDGEGSL
ncbi:DNA polymerase eta-like [Folsomia candida]|nr:DNA polymerase eta-like [Folsomia candida]XP_035712044.1 DNA polymerase eta-like [Folsomia candida]XP_035712045.1 DNA polymerase eta-like [Folsomia candida]